MQGHQKKLTTNFFKREREETEGSGGEEPAARRAKRGAGQEPAEKGFEDPEVEAELAKSAGGIR